MESAAGREDAGNGRSVSAVNTAMTFATAAITNKRWRPEQRVYRFGIGVFEWRERETKARALSIETAIASSCVNRNWRMRREQWLGMTSQSSMLLSIGCLR